MPDQVAPKRIEELRSLATKARRLADAIIDRQTVANLRSYADQLDADVKRLLEAGTIPAQALETQVPAAEEKIAALTAREVAEDKSGGEP